MFRRGLSGLLLLAASLAGAASPRLALGQDLTVEAVRARRAAVEKAADLDDETRDARLALYDQALESLAEGERWAAKIAAYEEAIARAPSMLGEIREELAAPPASGAPEIPAGATLARIEQERAAAETGLQGAQAELDKAIREREGRAARRGQLPKDVARAKQALEETLTERRALEGRDPRPPGAEARLTLLRARELSLRRELEAYQREVESYDRRRELLAARIERAERRVAGASGLVEAWRAIETRRRQEEADRVAAEAARAREQASRIHPLLEEIAAENEKYAGELRELAARRKATTAEKASLEGLTSRIEHKYQALAARVEAVGLTEAVGTLLRDERGKLPDLRKHRRRLRERRREISRAQVREFELREARASLDVEGELARLRARLDEAQPPLSEGERGEIRKEARGLLERRLGPDGDLSKLVEGYDGYLVQLVELDSAERALLATVEGFSSYVDERALWIRSTSPERVFAPARMLEAVRWFTSPGSWAGLGRTLARDAGERPALDLLALLLVGALLVLHERFRRVLVAIGRTADRKTSFAPSVYVLGLTVLLALVWPLLLWVIAWRVDSSAEASGFAGAMASGLRQAALLLFTIDLLRRICRPKGLADSHFRWPTRALEILRRHLFRLLLVAVPAAFVATVMSAPISDPRWYEWRDSLGCPAFLVLQGALALFALRVFRPSGGVLESVLRRGAGGWLARLRYLWYPLTVALPGGLFVLAALGYYYTALQLARRLGATIWLGIGFLILEAMILRWLLLARRRLALEKARRRREEAARAREAGGGAGGGEEERDGGARPEVEPEIDLGAINVQTRKLVQSFVALGFLGGVWLIWVDVLPALGILRHVELWGGGTANPVTLADLALAVLLLVMTVVATRNVPGLLEVSLLQRLPLKAGELYAITSISRYLLGIVGVVLTFGALGVGWSKVQWLAAALSVGLGFGLQEIVANFISGLILLLEQPIRVGDIVTVAGTSGRVTRMRMRATTITDWNRRELVIPNKSFITGELVNWTLTDTVSRIVFPVGVAYGTDVGVVRGILREIGRGCAYALEEPAPQVLFAGFGDSSLDFELRVFVPNRDHFLEIVNWVNSEIHRRFEEKGIEIPFPQRDVHVRSLEELGRLEGGGGGSGAGGSDAGG